MSDTQQQIPAADVTAAIHRLRFEVTQPFAENEVPAPATARVVSDPFPVKGSFPPGTAPMDPPTGWKVYSVVLADGQVEAIKGTVPNDGESPAGAAWLVVAKQVGGLPG